METLSSMTLTVLDQALVTGERAGCPDPEVHERARRRWFEASRRRHPGVRY
jgi:hypothetical protein